MTDFGYDESPTPSVPSTAGVIADAPVRSMDTIQKVTRVIFWKGRMRTSQQWIGLVFKVGILRAHDEHLSGQQPE
ncbi:hypothetical protein GCM10009628_40640 [Paeniglutamicibacter kerguelensis]